MKICYFLINTEKSSPGLGKTCWADSERRLVLCCRIYRYQRLGGQYLCESYLSSLFTWITQLFCSLSCLKRSLIWSLDWSRTQSSWFTTSRETRERKFSKHLRRGTILRLKSILEAVPEWLRSCPRLRARSYLSVENAIIDLDQISYNFNIIF